MLYINEVTEGEWDERGDTVVMSWSVEVRGVNEWANDDRHIEAASIGATEIDLYLMTVSIELDSDTLGDILNEDVEDLIDKHDPIDAGANYRELRDVDFGDDYAVLHYESEFDLEEAKAEGIYA